MERLCIWLTSHKFVLPTVFFFTIYLAIVLILDKTMATMLKILANAVYNVFYATISFYHFILQTITEKSY